MGFNLPPQYAGFGFNSGTNTQNILVAVGGQAYRITFVSIRLGRLSTTISNFELRDAGGSVIWETVLDAGVQWHDHVNFEAPGIQLPVTTSLQIVQNSSVAGDSVAGSVHWFLDTIS